MTVDQPHPHSGNPLRRYNPEVADPARRYNYWLGGNDNLAVDRASGNAIAQRFPPIRTAALENRRFLNRVVTTLARDGIDQFLDIGTGLPFGPNVHELAHQINPQAKVVYVDNSIEVVVHARALLTAAPGAAEPAYIDGDLRKPSQILNDQILRGALDLKRPVGLLLVAVLHFINDDDNPADIVRELLDALPSDSRLALSHLSAELLTSELRADFDAINAKAGIPMAQRSLAEIKTLVAGLEIAEPGIVPVNRWRADDEPPPRPSDSDVGVYGLLARKP